MLKRFLDFLDKEMENSANIVPVDEEQLDRLRDLLQNIENSEEDDRRN